MQLLLALSETLRAIQTPLVPIIQVGMAVAPDSVPKPDIVVTSKPDGESLVPLAWVALVVEVADVTVSQDTRRKATIYAEVGVPEYWVADVPDDRPIFAAVASGPAEHRTLVSGGMLGSVATGRCRFSPAPPTVPPSG